MSRDARFTSRDTRFALFDSQPLFPKELYPLPPKRMYTIYTVRRPQTLRTTARRRLRRQQRRIGPRRRLRVKARFRGIVHGSFLAESTSGHGAEQTPRVGVLRVGEDVLD